MHSSALDVISVLQAILRDSVVSVEIEVKPHNLVPDTNCFIDYLSELQIIARAGPAPQHYYTLMVPLVGKWRICDLLTAPVVISLQHKELRENYKLSSKLFVYKLSLYVFCVQSSNENVVSVCPCNRLHVLSLNHSGQSVLWG
jgi:hypothetical protein